MAPSSREEEPRDARRAPIHAEQAAEQAAAVRAQVERALRGKSDVVRRALECLVAGGHLLLEDVPGVGKTTLAHALARSVDAHFRRVQFTSDLLPSDVVGVSLPQLADGRPTGRFVFQPGPLFANVVLADEINRASPKTQSALLEAMSEASVTVDGVTHRLPDPFFVIATQNPLEQHGTHPLPESQLDRFLMRLAMGYPDRDAEAAVLRDDPAATELPRLEPVLDCAALRQMQQLAREVKFDDALVSYVLALAEATRGHPALAVGISTRAAVSLRRAAQARALVDGRDWCIPEDVQSLAVDVLAHRVILDAPPGAVPPREESAWVVREIVERLPVPL